MKPLYLVGTTADNKRLVLAKTKGAKFGSFSVPITPKLRRIFRELDEGRVENLASTGRGVPSSNGSEEPTPATNQASRSAPAAKGSGSFEGITGLTRRGGSAARQTTAPTSTAAKAQGSKRGRQAPPPQPDPQPEPEAPKAVERRPPINSKLAPAQIQALLRQGKSAKSVATEAGAPIEWVKRLMEPILLERMGIVEEMKRATYTKARKGPSVVPVGLSIIDNLRERGVAFPERAAARGWTAHRPDGREWRVRFTYEHRGANRTAQWEYDPPSRSVIPLNVLATQLSWRPDPASIAEGDDAESGRRPARRPAPRSSAPRRTSRKTPARKSSARKPAAKKSGAKRSGAKKPAAKKASGKSSARR